MERCRARFYGVGLVCVVAHCEPRNDRRTSEYTAVGITRVATGTLTSSNDTDSADLTNAAAITSPAATGATSAITYVGLWTALTGGTFVGSHLLTTAVTLALGEKIRIPAGDLDISFPIA